MTPSRRAINAAAVALVFCLVTPAASADHSGLESVPPCGDPAAISDDGRHVFSGTCDYFNGVSTNIAPSAAGMRIEDFSPDGERVIFSTTSSLSGADTDSRRDVYEYVGGVRTLLSTGTSGGNAAIDAEFRGANEDATHVYFTTTEQLEPGDTDAAADLYERFAGTTTHVSIGPFGGNSTGFAQYGGSSTDGSKVFFSTSDQLTSDDMDGRPDVYQREGGTVTRLSLGPVGGNGTFHAFYAGSTPDGSKVFFQTRELLTTDDLDDENRDTFVREGSTTTLLSTGPLPPSAAIAEFAGASSDGSRVLFVTNEPLLPDDLDIRNDVYERSGGTTTLLSVGPSGGNADIIARFEGMSEDGTKVFFTTPESLVPEDADSANDVYERSGGVTTLVSTSATDPHSFGGSFFAGASADGTRVFFTSQEQLVPEAPPVPGLELLLYERVGGATYYLRATRLLDTSRSGKQIITRFSGGVDLQIVGPYVRPKGASPLRVSLVPAFAECAAPNLVHGPSLEHDSCGPPQPASSNLTVGWPEGGATANMTGFVRLGVVVGAAGPPDDSDVAITASITDVRCQAGVATCGPSNLGGGEDYSGEVQVDAGIRLTDRLNTDSDTATVQDASFPVTVPCSPTVATDRGSSCTVSTSANAVLPGSVLDSQRAIWALDGVQVLDGGADGDAETAGDNGLFAKQGLFVP